jgi:hypothetical protein
MNLVLYDGIFDLDDLAVFGSILEELAVRCLMGGDFWVFWSLALFLCHNMSVVADLHSKTPRRPIKTSSCKRYSNIVLSFNVTASSA